MATAFPDVCPQRRQFNAGKYPTKRFTSLSGASVTRLYGTQPFEATISVSYLLTDAETAPFLKSWHDARGDSDTLTLPASIYGGMDAALTAEIKTYSWRWSAPPRIQSVMAGRSRIEVSLVGTLDIS